MHKQMMITTTDVLQGYTITAYEGYIEASSTVGSGFLTEFLSSWTDSFGRKSNMIENKLHIIKQDVIKKLEDQAMKKGCNAIIGLHIDVDEISSNQKMIFMITACGTAVQCEKQNALDMGMRISGEYLNKKIVRSKQYIQELNTIQTAFQNNDSDSLILFRDMVNKLLDESFFDFIEQAFINCLLAGVQHRPGVDFLDEEVKEILNNLVQHELPVLLLEYLLQQSSNNEIVLQFRKTASYPSLCDYFALITPLSLLLAYLKKGNDHFTVIMLYPLLMKFKEYYEKEDIGRIQQIIDKLKERHWNDSLEIETLSNTTRICECGHSIAGETSCSCGSTNSISYATFSDKRQLIEHLGNVQRELRLLLNHNI